MGTNLQKEGKLRSKKMTNDEKLEIENNIEYAEIILSCLNAKLKKKYRTHYDVKKSLLGIGNEVKHSQLFIQQTGEELPPPAFSIASTANTPVLGQGDNTVNQTIQLGEPLTSAFTIKKATAVLDDIIIKCIYSAILIGIIMLIAKGIEYIKKSRHNNKQ